MRKNDRRAGAATDRLRDAVRFVHGTQVGGLNLDTDLGAISDRHPDGSWVIVPKDAPDRASFVTGLGLHHLTIRAVREVHHLTVDLDRETGEGTFTLYAQEAKHRIIAVLDPTRSRALRWFATGTRVSMPVARDILQADVNELALLVAVAPTEVAAHRLQPNGQPNYDVYGQPITTPFRKLLWGEATRCLSRHLPQPPEVASAVAALAPSWDGSLDALVATSRVALGLQPGCSGQNSLAGGSSPSASG